MLNQLVQTDSQGILTNVLSYHAVPGKITSYQLRALVNLKTASGQNLIVNNYDELRIDGGRLLQTDIEARNGVIHAIDRLLLPTKAATA